MRHGKAVSLDSQHGSLGERQGGILVLVQFCVFCAPLKVVFYLSTGGLCHFYIAIYRVGYFLCESCYTQGISRWNHTHV